MTNPTPEDVRESEAVLLPCPVCGEQPRWRGTRSDYARGIYRLQCLGETHLFQAYGPDEATTIVNWNNRAHPAAPSAVAEEGEPVACPFCKSTDLFVERVDLSSCCVICNDCGARGPSSCDENDADADATEAGECEPGERPAWRLWNTRPSPAHDKTAPVGEVECEYCGGSGEIFGHADDCDMPNCALACGIDDCSGKVEPCGACTPAPEAETVASPAGESEARSLLREAGELFRFYERSHRAKTKPGGQFDQPGKGQDDTIAKAERNAEIATRIEAALASPARNMVGSDEEEAAAKRIHLSDEPAGQTLSLSWDDLLDETRERYRRYALAALRGERP